MKTKSKPRQIKCLKVSEDRIVYLPEHLANDLEFQAKQGIKVLEPSSFNPEKANYSKKQEPIIEDELPPVEDLVVKSIDLSPWSKAKAELKNLSTVEEVQEFIDGETRKSVLEAAEELIKTLQ